jgi:hypothetical protein
MSTVKLGKDDTAEGGQRNTVFFLEEAGFTGFPDVIQVLGKFDGLDDQIEEVSSATLKEKNQVIGNFIFTRDKDITLIIKPGDCPVAVIYCKDRDGNDMLVVNHAGRQATNAGISFQGAKELESVYGVDLSKARVFLVPGAGRQSFWVSGEPEVWPNSIVERNWGKYIDEDLEDKSDADYPKKPGTNIQLRSVDMGRATVMQLIKAGFLPENIEFYDKDTYVAAANEETFSERQSAENKDEEGNPKRVGRFVVAVQFKKAI